MRMFDIKNSWLDDEGKPLIGRVKFCKLHTTVLENVYDNQGYVCNNPMYTNTIGQLDSQVFLKDNTDYTVRFEKYIGNGDMSEDQDNWLHIYSCDDLWNTYGIEIDATSFQLVNNITDLRNLDPSTVATRDNNKVIILGGYNVIGDKPQVMYIWNPTTTSSDNGGNIIKVNNISNGRWELVNNFGPDGVDVRHFGVFGADSKSEATDLMSIQINVANQYAAYNTIPLYFPAIDGLTWYKMNGLNLYNSIFAEETRVFGNSNNPNIITMINENGYLDCYSDSDYHTVFRIRGAVVRTSWGENTDNCIYEPTYKLIVDSVINTNHKDWSNIIVECISEISYAQFDSCEIRSVEKLGDWTSFSNCRLEERMFIDSTDFDTVTVQENDIIDLADWPTTWKWLKLKTQNAWTELYMDGRTLDANCQINWVGQIAIADAVLDGFSTAQSNVLFQDCAGTLTLTGALQNVVFDNSNIQVTITNGTARPQFIARKNAEITFTNGYIISSNAIITDSTIHGNINSSGYITCKNSSIDALTLLGNLDLQNCIVTGAVVMTPAAALVGLILLNNTFHEPITLTGANLVQTVYNARIEDNYSDASPTAIIIDRTYIDPDDSHHAYTYKNNIGSFIPDETVIQGTYLAKPRHYFGGGENSFAQTSQGYHTFVVPTETNFGAIYNTSVPFENVTFFTIGTSNINVKMKVRTLISSGLSRTSFVDIILKGIHLSDYNWGLVVHTSGNWPLGPGGWYIWKQFPAYYPTNFIQGDAVHVEESSTLPSDYNINMMVEYEIIR